MLRRRHRCEYALTIDGANLGCLWPRRWPRRPALESDDLGHMRRVGRYVCRLTGRTVYLHARTNVNERAVWSVIDVPWPAGSDPIHEGWWRG